MQYFQDKIIDIIESHPTNLANAVDKIIMIVYTKTEECPPDILRQRTFIMWALVDALRIDPTLRSSVNTIMEQIGFCCKKVLEIKGEEYAAKLKQTPFTCEKLTEETLAMILKVRPKKFVPAIRALYNIADENSEMASTMKKYLKNLIRNVPELVVQWIEAFELYEFKDIFLTELTVSILLNGCDIKALLFPDPKDRHRQWVQKVVEMLDKTLEQRPYARSLHIQELYGKFSDIDICKIISKYAQESNLNMVSYCPHTVLKRRMQDFVYILHQKTTEERQNLTMQVIKEFDQLNPRDVIRALRVYESKETYAGIAFGEMYRLTPEELCKINAEYNEISKWARADIDEKIRELKLTLGNSNYIDTLALEDGKFQIYLIDDATKFSFALKMLQEADMVAFDVEAGYVCQSVDSRPNADLIQMAIKECVLLIDIFSLKKTISEEHLKIFFEVFFDPNLKRIGFDIKSDLDYLRQTFPWLSEYFHLRQPAVYCLQTFVKIVSKNTEYHEYFPVISTPSLSQVVEKWLNKTISKKERTGNWQLRPLTQVQMTYAAIDAKYTLEAFVYANLELKKRGLDIDEVKFLLSPRDVDYKGGVKEKLTKETIQEIMEVIGKKAEELKAKFHNLTSPELITIVVDFPFLFLTPLLRRLGYKTYDQRDEEGGEKFSREQCIQKLSSYLRDRLADATIRRCFLLCDAKAAHKFEVESDIGGATIIMTPLIELESSIISNIMELTQSVVDLTDVLNRCSGCSKTTSCLKVGANVYRAIYIHYARVKQFIHKLKLTEDNYDEILKNLIETKVVKVVGEWLYFRVDNGRLAFALDDQIQCKVRVKSEEPFKKEGKYKCDTGVFNRLADNEDDVNFCYKCCVFF